jgi:hypothetical protein
MRPARVVRVDRRQLVHRPGGVLHCLGRRRNGGGLAGPRMVPGSGVAGIPSPPRLPSGRSPTTRRTPRPPLAANVDVVAVVVPIDRALSETA